MRADIPAQMLYDWQEGIYLGDKRAFGRVTIQKPRLSLNKIFTQRYATLPFHQASRPRELPNVKSINWERNIDAEAATCTVVLHNTTPLNPGMHPEGAGVLDLPGWFCADEATEVLSERGWLKHDQVALGDRIYTVNPITGFGEWAPVLEMFAKPYDGDLVLMQSKSLSALVTSNHRWAVTNKSRLAAGDVSLKIRETNELARHDLIPVARPCGDAPAATLTDDMVELLGWVSTEGSYQRCDGKRVTIYQSEAANPANCERIRMLLKRLGHVFSERLDDRTDTIAFRFSHSLARQVRALLPERKLSMPLIESLTVEQRTLLLEVLSLGDGGLVGGGTPYVCTKDEEQAGVIQALCSLAGLTSRVHRRELITQYSEKIVMWYVNVKKARHVRVVDTKPQSQYYAGIVWCPRTVNQTFLARRAGRTYFTGNTYNRGDSEYSTSWGHAPNKWQDWIVPDRVLRTYQGYGVDTSRIPELDDNLVCTGTWLIDDVDYSVDGTITVVCRDFARLLIDQIMFPPVVPLSKYPLSFEGEHLVNLPDNITKTTRTATGFVTPTYQTSGNAPYTGDGPVFGHYPKHAFDSSTSTYWLSTGNAQPDHPYSYEYIQGSLSNAAVKGVKFKVWGGPYRCYIGVKVNGVWQGSRVVPYDPNNPASAPNGANVRYVKAISVSYEEEITYNFLNDGYESVDAVRLTFTHLYNSRLGTFPYRAGVRKFQVVATTTKAVTVVTDGGTETRGNYGDYVDIVKLLLAYGGFYWPKFSNKAFFTRSDGVKVVHTYTGEGLTDDTGMPSDYGRVWADVEPSGTVGPAELGVEIFDKKPLMEGINHVKDILGYNFYIDELGAAVFRVPNIWTVGNYINESGQRATRTSLVYTIDESQTILTMRSRLTSRSVREKVFVANVAGTVGAVAYGFNPYPANFRRVAGWTDQQFKTAAECRIMADLITVRQMWNYRSNSVTIPGFPGIQIDDQVRIVERVTGESYHHYIKSISSTWDSADGQWTYDLGTHWLGETPLGKWFVDKTKLAAETQAFLTALGKL